MNIRRIKKIIGLSFLFFGWIGFLITVPANSDKFYSETFESKVFNNPNEEISSEKPLLSDFSDDNIIFQSLPNAELLDNSDIINSFYSYLEDDSIIYDRPPSIISTYFIVSILFSIDPDLLLPKANKILDYLSKLYNPETERFEDSLNYTYYNQRYDKGKELLLAPYTPEITHEMALVILKKCDKLSSFSSAQINRWITDIWSNQNIDGGFGTLFSPNSTILETYYSVECLLTLNDYDNSIFSIFQKNVIENFIESRQRTSDWATIGIGAFGEYSEDPLVGWEFFYASWLALNSIEMIGGDFSNVKDDFINFILDNGLNNPVTHCFYSIWNDRAAPDIITYYGTAILGDCIRILDAETQFPDIFDCQSTLISANIMEESGIDLDYNYFYWASDVSGDDLFSQFLIVNYLCKVDLWNMVNEQEFIDYYLSFITENGGGVYTSNIWGSAKGDFLKYNSLKYSGINESQIFDLVMSRKIGTYFGDLRNISTSPQDLSFKILQHWNEWTYYPIATNYFSIRLLDEYDLLENFYIEVGSEYEDFIEWFHGKLTLEGYFSNSLEYMVSGNLESTYYALESQKILLDYDELHNINDYYTFQEINSILTYCEQFIIEDAENWYVDCSESLENQYLGKFQSIIYVLSIEEILDGNRVGYEKLENFLLYSYYSEWNSLSMKEKTNLLYLLVKFNCSFPNLDSEISHIQIRNNIQYIISQDHYPEDEVNFISQLLKDSNIKVYLDLPSNQIMGKSYTYLAQLSSVSSLISVENLNIRSYDSDFSDWYSLGSMVACEVMFQFDELNPYSWDVSIDFTFREINYSYPFSLDVSIPFLSNTEIISNGDYVRSLLSVECPESLATELRPDLYLYDSEGDLITLYQIINMSVDQQQDSVNWDCNISENLEKNHNYTIIWDFNFDFLENVSVSFIFLGDTPPILHNETISHVKYHFEFLIFYSDHQENLAEYVKLNINGTFYLMSYLNESYSGDKIFKYDLILDIGNYTYHFSANDGKNFIKYPENGSFYLNVIESSEIMPENKPTKIGNYIIESIISLGSVGAGVSGFVFKNKGKLYQKILSKHL
jgi:hypothetical protein